MCLENRVRLRRLLDVVRDPAVRHAVGKALPALRGMWRAVMRVWRDGGAELRPT
jgi:hypothetical protein